MPRRPLEILNLATLLILAALAAYGAAAGRLAGAAALAVRYGALLAVVLIVARLLRGGRALPGWAHLLLDFYPLAFIPLVFDTLGRLIPAVNPAERDAWLVAADRWLFGVDPTVWLQRAVRPALTDAMYLAYCTYFLFPPAVAVVLYRRARPLGRWFIFVATFAFYVSYAGYVLVPARGPRAVLTHSVRLQVTPISRAVADGMNAVEHNKLDAFPSGHVMLAAVCLLVAARHARRLFAVLLPVGILLAISTVYCRYHYVIDVLAGLVLAPFAVWAGDRLYALLGGKEVVG